MSMPKQDCTYIDLRAAVYMPAAHPATVEPCRDLKRSSALTRGVVACPGVAAAARADVKSGM